MTVSRSTGLRSKETRNQRFERAANLPGGVRWPQLRIGRLAVLDVDPDWDNFQNHLDRMNKRYGRAYTMGRFACHYLTDTEMRSMIIGKYDKASDSRAKATEIYRGVQQSVRRFIDGEAAASISYYKEVVLDSDIQYGGRPSAPRPPQSQTWVPATMDLRSGESGAIDIYGNDKWGLDLSLNDFLTEERQQILTHLRQAEGLNTRLARADWRPHVTIFEVYPHLRADDMNLKLPRDLRPDSIQFGAPAAMLDL